MNNKKEVGIILGVSALIVILGVILFLFLTKKKTYTVTFNTNGGKEISSIKVKQNESIGTLPKAEKDGYIFLYWVMDGTIIKEDYKVEKDITLEARYDINVDNVKTYIITFNTDGGSEISSQEIRENEKIKYPGEPIKEGYKFKMWTINGEPADLSKPVISDMTLKAEYEKVTTSTTKKTTTVKPTTKNVNTSTSNKKTTTTTTIVTTTTTKNTTAFNANCKYDGELIPGVEYINGDYTYKYRQLFTLYKDKELTWTDFNMEGWWAVSTESLKAIKSGLNSNDDGFIYQTSTKPITSKLCKTVNGKPILSMSKMFLFSNATSIDFNSFDTSSVIDMSYMFSNSAVKKLDLSSFNTSKVKNMGYMFNNSAATMLDLSSFDISNATDIREMFHECAATTGYARTEEDANRFNNTNKPSTLTFVVKS